ncbi:MAG: TatD family hydrolase [Phycisphaeraceae bacterium]|nr:TatD family hydrolase [Phycisphaeraceae bacterium]MCW5763859.1 TatD family hydrolase [Phycisphaeraceae bacterium]
MIDTHCHLVFPDFVDRVDAVLAEAAAAGVTGAITIATSSADAEAGMRLAEDYERVWFSAGVHPLYSDEEPHDWMLLKALARHEKCVAWGELGLDNHHAKPARAIQDRVLADQIAFIESCMRDGIDLPIVLHCREAFDDLIPILRSSGIAGDRCVFHCFTGGEREARLALDFGSMISFTGVVTYRNAREVQAAAMMVPLERVMIETDAPYLSPEPKRGVRPCVPAFARLTADFVARLRGLSSEAFLDVIDENTERFFGIPVRGP